jgi:hypothetical protein
MRPLAVAALLVLAAACSDSPCQKLGERICRCQAGMTEDSCKTQVDNQLGDLDPGEDLCQARLDACNAPAGADFCEWLLTEDGKDACGLTAPPPQPPPAP